VAVQKAAWTWVKQHWPEVEPKLTAWFGGSTIVNATHNFCDADARADVQDFFAGHKMASSERALQQSLERIDSCISFRNHQQANLAAWLQQRAGTSANGTR